MEAETESDLSEAEGVCWEGWWRERKREKDSEGKKTKVAISLVSKCNRKRLQDWQLKWKFNIFIN